MNLVDRLFNGNSGGGIVPSGTIYITENGEGIDVSSYATADVNVSGGGGATIPVFTYNGNTETASCDTSYSACLALVEEHNNPFAYVAIWDEEYPTVYGNMTKWEEPGTGVVKVNAYYMSEMFSYASDGTITYSEE